MDDRIVCTLSKFSGDIKLRGAVVSWNYLQIYLGPDLYVDSRSTGPLTRKRRGEQREKGIIIKKEKKKKNSNNDLRRKNNLLIVIAEI